MVRMQPQKLASSLPDSLSVNPLFARRSEDLSVPRFVLPADSMLPETAYQIVHDEAMLDGNARLNLATFVTTWMEPTASKLYSDTFDKNMIDKDEYPLTAIIEERCWRMLADLWHAPDPEHTIGTSAIGSSEACMLGGLALKRRWQQARRSDGKPTDRPNLVMSSAVQVVWEKFANYWEVEPRYIPVTDDHPTLDGYQIDKYVDENTIGVVAILGQTYIGVYEPVQAIAGALDDLQARTGLDIPIHVDGASGAFVAPFLRPDLIWDFQLPRVHSISTSGHKYGLVYPGVGWVVWRTADLLPDDLIFRVSYLGGEMPTLALNFSRPGAQVLAAVLQLPAVRVRGLPAGATGQPGRGAPPVPRDRRHGAVRAAERWLGPAGLRVATWPELQRHVGPARSQQPTAGERLASAGLPDARQPQRPHRSAHRGT